MSLPIYGVSETIGWRESMEDAHEAGEHLGGRIFAAGVYDGHGGALAARVAAQVLTPFFLRLWLAESQKPPHERRPDAELVRLAYLAADDFITARCGESGAAAASFYLLEDRFLAANAGDARIVVGTAAGALSLTVDHKPGLPQEKARIEALGGKVLFCDVPRVQGVLAMSRALGDAYLKPFVSSEPRVVEGLLGRENDCL
ncbi:MAG: PP2C family serine/threonine-protein phosphatase, partial [Moorellales bacterium]